MSYAGPTPLGTDAERLQREADRLALERYAPAGVLCDEELNIHHAATNTMAIGIVWCAVSDRAQTSGCGASAPSFRNFQGRNHLHQYRARHRRASPTSFFNRVPIDRTPSYVRALHTMTMKLLEDRGTPLNRQHFTWRELASKPISKLDDDAFTRFASSS